MTRTRSAAGWAIAASAALVASMAFHSPAVAAPHGHDRHGTPVPDDTSDVGPDFNNGKPQPLKHGHLVMAKKRTMAQRRSFAAASDGDPQVGDVRTWLAEDDTDDSIYLKDYTLRGVGDHIEVWVANDRAFPAGDCRNALGMTDITDSQVSSFIKEFDSNIYPTESAAFSVPPDRDGSGAALFTDSDGTQKPIGAGQVDQSRADDTVVLVDNVKDANYYAPGTPDGQTYIAGFFWSTFNSYADRNIMTIDAYDWLHRTGANPPDDSGDPGYQACAAASGAPRPHLYEGTFAHEYQHLLEHYVDPDETSWVNEGLSDYAQTLVGYVDPSVPVTDPSADSHIGCFSGFLSGQGYGGPENSLTRWGDQGGPEILCDYGAAYSFMQYLYGHYGEAFMSQLHKEPGNGLEGLQAVLDAHGSSESAMDVVHRWAAAMALDNVVDNGAKLAGGDPEAYSEDTLGAQINWAATYGDINHDGTSDDPGNEAYATPGAAPNGSDYVRLGRQGTQQGHGRKSAEYFTAHDLHSLDFNGSASLPPDPIEWTSVDDAPGHDGDPALFSGRGDEIDHSAVLPAVTVKAGDQLTFDTSYDTEEGWDFFFVQVSTDGGKTWKSLPVDGTTEETDPSAYPTVQDNVPGFTGDSKGWVSKSYDLSEYAGQQVLINFRYITDWATNLDGVWLDNVAVGGNTLVDGSSTQGLRSMTEVNPVPVAGYTVQLVGYTADGSRAWIGRVPVRQAGDGSWRARLNTHDLRSMLGKSKDSTVAAIVMQDDPTESVTKYARYTLTVNGVEQPGG